MPYGPGWALVGDAAAFLDPYYSPGLDHAAFSVEASVALVIADAGGDNEGDLLSYLLFDGEYAADLVRMGMRDADAKRQELIDFFRV